MQLPILDPQPSCTSCNLYQLVRNPGLPSRWLNEPLTTRPLLWVLSSAPRVEDDISRTTFSDLVGTLTREAYLSDFLPLTSILLTNTARCGFRKPTRRHFTTCFNTHTFPELLRLAPLFPSIFCLLLGAEAASTFYKVLTGTKTFTTSQALAASGKPLPLPTSCGTLAITPVTTFHPGYVLATPSKLKAVQVHLSLLLSLVTAPNAILVKPLQLLEPGPPPPLTTAPFRGKESHP